MANNKKHKRRLFLQGAGGCLLALPILEIMLNSNGDAYADGGELTPNYIYTTQGESSGHNKWNGTTRRYDNVIFFQPPSHGNLKSIYSKSSSHTGFTGLHPLDTMGLWDDVNVISNLAINTNRKGTPGNVQVSGGSEMISIHNHSNYVISSGHGLDNRRKFWTSGEKKGKFSADQLINDAIGGNKKVMIYSTDERDHWTHSTSFRDGSIIKAEKNIGRAFDLLFKGFSPTSTGNSAANQLRESRRSILNLVLEDHKRLEKKLSLGYKDRLQVDQHMQLISDLEKSIAKMENEVKLACQIPKRISENASIDTSFSWPYGGLKERAVLLNQLITLACACGAANVANYAILRHKAEVPTSPFIPNISASEARRIDSDKNLNNFHGCGHHGTKEGSEVWAHGARWVTKTYGDLVQRFKDVPMGSGTMLDYSFIMLAMQQGRGRSMEGSEVSTSHSYENMCFLQAGGKALGAKTGRHIDGQKKHPVAISNKAAELMGLKNLQFGEIEDKVNIS